MSESKIVLTINDNIKKEAEAVLSSFGLNIENAINIPMKHLEENIKNLPKDKKIIVYCRGRNCAYANLASKLLNNNGFQAYSLNQSYYDWQKNKNF